VKDFEYLTEEEQREEALQANYALGNYGVKFCNNCGQIIEKYRDIKGGLCSECKEENEDCNY